MNAARCREEMKNQCAAVFRNCSKGAKKNKKKDEFTEVNWTAVP